MSNEPAPQSALDRLHQGMEELMSEYERGRAADVAAARARRAAASAEPFQVDAEAEKD